MHLEYCDRQFTEEIYREIALRFDRLYINAVFFFTNNAFLDYYEQRLCYVKY